MKDTHIENTDTLAYMKDTLRHISNVTSLERYHILLTMLKSAGIPYHIQKSKYAENIILFPENYDKNNIVFTAHYDIVFGSCGANDNGAAITILLLLARHLTQHADKSIMIVFLDREETGGMGCDLFFRTHCAGIVVNMDVCGCGDRIVICDETSYHNDYAPFFRSAMTKNIMESDAFPYCDGRHAERMGFDVWSISVFPEHDALHMAGNRLPMYLKDKMYRHEQDISFLYQYMVHDIMAQNLEINKYMHCAIYDDMEHINYNIMQQLYNYLISVLDLLQYA